MKQLDYYLQLKISKENSEELLFFSIPLLSKVVIEKEVYQKNNLLKEFTEEVFNEVFGEYLYDSRPLLYSRLVKQLIMLQKEDQDKFSNIQMKLQLFISNSILNKNKNVSELNKVNSKSKGNKKVIDDWRTIIDS